MITILLADDEALVRAGLTDREREVLVLVARGPSNAEIARQLVGGTGTVRRHVARVLNELGVRGRVQAVVAAHGAGLVRPGSRRPPGDMRKPARHSPARSGRLIAGHGSGVRSQRRRVRRRRRSIGRHDGDQLPTTSVAARAHRFNAAPVGALP